MKKTLIFMIIINTLFGCSNDDNCLSINAPSQTFIFEIVDKISGENLFANGTYEPEQIQITNTVNNFPVEFTFISEDNTNQIQINSDSWETEIINLKFDISNNHIFNFYSEGERIMRKCFSYTEFNEIVIEESEFELNAETGIYRILVE